MELFIFAKFCARDGQEEAIATVLRQQILIVRDEPGCLAIAAYRSVRNAREFWIHSRWRDEKAFDIHAELPQTEQFIARMQTLTDRSPEISRTNEIA